MLAARLGVSPSGRVRGSWRAVRRPPGQQLLRGSRGTTTSSSAAINVSILPAFRWFIPVPERTLVTPSRTAQAVACALQCVRRIGWSKAADGAAFYANNLWKQLENPSPDPGIRLNPVAAGGSHSTVKLAPSQHGFSWPDSSHSLLRWQPAQRLRYTRC